MRLRTTANRRPFFTRRERFERRDGGHFWLSETPDVPGSQAWDAALPRMASWVELRDRQTGQDILFCNTHFDHVGQEARLQSAAVIRHTLQERAADRDLRVILTGDFNTGQGTPPYRDLLSWDRLQDSFRQRFPTSDGLEGTFNSWRATRDRARIDWVLSDAACQVLRAGIDRHSLRSVYPSDHYAVWAILAAGSPN